MNSPFARRVLAAAGLLLATGILVGALGAHACNKKQFRACVIKLCPLTHTFLSHPLNELNISNTLCYNH